MLLEDYALIGDQQAAAMVGRNGAVPILAARAISKAEASPELAAG